ncbi:MAG: hypothetical protein F6K56_42590, partial [Moorea sp. SIO3G5]|nr:hypothetical protein [Moorena sp. SIO3G5]
MPGEALNGTGEKAKMTTTTVRESPFIINPYIVGRPISEPELFFGRGEEFGFIEDNLR